MKSPKTDYVLIKCRCGNEFKTYPYRADAKYCSMDCQRKYRTYGRPGKLKKICQICGKDFITWKCKEKRGNGKFCSKECFAVHLSVNVTDEQREIVRKRLVKHGSEHQSWRGGRYINFSGYAEIWVENHPYMNRSHRVLEHRLVMESHIGRHLEPKEAVHHIDGNRLNNSIENLHLCSDSREHMTQHMIEKYPGATPSKTGWSTIWDSCLNCDTQERRHVGKGLCTLCFKYQWSTGRPRPIGAKE